MDFFQVTRGEKITTNLSVNYEGSPLGVKEGGILETYVDEVEIVCLPKDLPSEITIDISELGLHESIYADRLPELEGVEFQMSPETVLVSVVYAQKEKEEEPEQEEEMETEESI
jgi:large subunit ribosomal protein L25